MGDMAGKIVSGELGLRIEAVNLEVLCPLGELTPETFAERRSIGLRYARWRRPG